MHMAKDEGRSEAAIARRRHLERHLGCCERLQAPPQAFKLCAIDAAPTRPA
jgi:hypothetical protein